MEEHQKLMKDQAEIERKYGLKVQGLTLFDTIFEVRKKNTMYKCLLKSNFIIVLCVL